MKALFIGDNRTSANWGGRSASIALYRLLSSRFEISGVIFGTSFLLGSSGFGFVNTLMPPRYNWVFLHLLLNRKKRRIFDWYVKIEELLGAKDFISEDPEESVENILRYKEKDRDILAIYKQAVEADILVLDGDGDFVLTTPPRRQVLFMLAMIELGYQLGKKVFFVNAMISDCPQTGRNMATLKALRTTLSKCSAVSLRDPESLKYAKKEMPEIRCTLIPDSLFSWFPIYQEGKKTLPANGDFLIPYPEYSEYLGRLDFSKPYICIGGSVAPAGKSSERTSSYVRMVNHIKELGYPVYLTENDGPDDFLRNVARECGAGLVPATTPIFMGGAVLANAELLISGRYHATILASLGGTPCIFLGSHGHKMASLQRVLEYDDVKEYPVILSDDDIGDLLFRAESYLSAGNNLRQRILAVSEKRCKEGRALVDLIRINL